jgi:hypothetical protein
MSSTARSAIPVVVARTVKLGRDPGRNGQITTSITTRGDASSPHSLLPFDHQRTSETPAEIHPARQQLKGGQMSEIPAGPQHDQGRYEIRLRGHLESRWAAWFDGLSLTSDSDGTTLIHGPVADQAALYGLLQKVRDLGLPLISVAQVKPGQPNGPAIEPR